MTNRVDLGVGACNDGALGAVPYGTPSALLVVRADDKGLHAVVAVLIQSEEIGRVVVAHGVALTAVMIDHDFHPVIPFAASSAFTSQISGNASTE